MYSLTVPLRKARNWWFHLCTGRSVYEQSDEEHHRQRILVMTSGSWLITITVFTFAVPLLIEKNPSGQIAAYALFFATFVGVLISMMILRFRGDRLMALNVLMVIYFCAFSASCFVRC